MADSASTSKLRHAAATKPSGQETGPGGTAKLRTRSPSDSLVLVILPLI